MLHMCIFRCVCVFSYKSNDKRYVSLNLPMFSGCRNVSRQTSQLSQQPRSNNSNNHFSFATIFLCNLMAKITVVCIQHMYLTSKYSSTYTHTHSWIRWHFFFLKNTKWVSEVMFNICYAFCRYVCRYIQKKKELKKELYFSRYLYFCVCI